MNRDLNTDEKSLAHSLLQALAKNTLNRKRPKCFRQFAVFCSVITGEKSMAKMILVLCDVKPCTGQADREFEVNGKTLYVCGEQCFMKFWSREYGEWKHSPYKTQIIFHQVAATNQYSTQKVAQKINGPDIFRSDLKILKPEQVN